MATIINKLNELLGKENFYDIFGQHIKLSPQLPVVFIVGLPRSGTTPLAQLMIQRFRLGYVSNLIAKFWAAPEVGIALVREISQGAGSFSSLLNSQYGFTEGYEGHHEFGYFWRRWFDFKETHYLDRDAQAQVDVKRLKKSLSVMEKAWQRPLFFKNAAALPLQTAFLANILPTSMFIHIKRDPLDVAASLLKGRRKYMGDETKWFSIKPREYTFLKNKSVPEQIAGQIYYTQKEIDKQLEQVPPHRKFTLMFSDLFPNADYELHRIGRFLKDNYPDIEERKIELPMLSRVSESQEEPFLLKIKKFLTNMSEEEA